MSDRRSIEAALRRVQSGELSPEAATQLLLAAENTEPLQSLLDRLGTPPRDIVEAWCDQLRLIASAHEAETGEPIPEIEMDQWSIDRRGELLWRGKRYPVSPDAQPATPISLDRIRAFGATWIPAWNIADRSPASSGRHSTIPEPSIDTSAAVVATGTENDQASRLRRTLRGRMPRFAAVALAAIAVAALIGSYLLYPSASDRRRHVGNRQPDLAAPNHVAQPIGTPRRPLNDPQTPPADDPTSALETFESIADTVPAEPSIGSVEAELSLSLDGLIPPVGGAATAAAGEPIAGEPRPIVATVGTSDSDSPADPSGTAAPQDGELTKAQPEPAESLQQTRPSTAMAVQLGAVGEPGDPVSLSTSRLNGLKLQFPFDAPFEIQPDEADWSIRDKATGVAVATIRRGSAGTWLAWTPQARRSNHWAALVHGRLEADQGETVFLRPTVESDAWRFDLSQPDVKPTWDLIHPIPPRAAKVDVRLHLPDGIEFGWIEPIKTTEIRRAGGTAVINAAGDEEVALGLRIDLRCTRKCSCRIRFAARLDPSMNWQPISKTMLEQFSAQLTQQASLVDNELVRLDHVYRELRDRDQQTLIRGKQDRTKAFAARIETGLQRTARLQSLIAMLESDAAIGVHIWVDWPDDQQTLLSATRSDAD